MSDISKFEKKVFSQNGEDGVIQHIFKNIGFKSKIFVEFGYHMNENNTNNLIMENGCKGLCIDGNMPKGTHRQGDIFFHSEWITRGNINDIIGKYFKGDIDFLSIDVDGNDLYLLDTINVVNPRVVCIEFCASIGKEHAATVVYRDDFDRHKAHPSGFYCNASLKANVNVMKKKGYKFVGCVAGLNAFFVRNDCEMNELKEVTCDEGWQPHFSRTHEVHRRYDGTTRKLSPEEQYDWIKGLDWVMVSDDGIIEEENIKSF